MAAFPTQEAKREGRVIMEGQAGERNALPSFLQALPSPPPPLGAVLLYSMVGEGWCSSYGEICS